MRPEVDGVIEPGDAILALPGARIGEALALLPPGHAWSALLPGADPAAAVSALGGPEAALGPGSVLRAIALPFQVDPPLDSRAMAVALVAPATWRQGDPGPGPDEFELRLPGRREIEAAALACLDQAAATCLEGGEPDPLVALLTCPGIDLRPLVRLADLDARLRFLEALSDARVAAAAGRDGMEGFRNSYFRRSAAAGLVAAARRALASPPWADEGRDEEGWPVWWRAGVADLAAAEDALPPGLRNAPGTPE